MLTHTNDETGMPNLIKDVFDFCTALLGFLPTWFAQLIVAIVLALLLLFLLGWLLRKFLPSSAPVLAAFLSEVLGLLGYLLLLVEWAPTQVLRLARLRPPRVVYAYDELVIRATMAAKRWSRAGLAMLQHFSKTPRWMVVICLLLTLAVWNQTTCSEDDASCRPPVQTWTADTKAWFRATFSSSDEPCPSPSATTGQPAASCAPNPPAKTSR